MNKPAYLLVGDVHGSLGCMRYAVAIAKDRGIRTMFQLGDFQFIWTRCHVEDELDTLDQLQLSLAAAGITLYVIFGNHEGFPRLANMTWERWPNILILESGGALIIDGVVVGAIHGAVSPDKDSRRDGVNLFSEEERSKAADAKRLPKCDVLLSHDCAYMPPGFVGLRGIPDWLRMEMYDNRHVIKMALTATGATRHFHGHTHWSHQTTYEHDGVSVYTVGLNNNRDEGFLAVVDKHFNLLEII